MATGPVKVSKRILWRAIRAKCLDCSGGSVKERQLCPVTDCPLYPYRNTPEYENRVTAGQVNEKDAKKVSEVE